MLILKSGRLSYSQTGAGERDPFKLHLAENHTFNLGDIVAFTGGNGSGKTTLLNCIAGFNEGQIIKEGLAAIWQQDNLVCSATDVVTYLEAHPLFLYIFNVKEYLQLAKYSRKRIADSLGKKSKLLADIEIKKTIEYFDLISDASTRMLSSGQKKRLGLAMIQLQQSPFIMLDEPHANLDQKGENLLKEIMHEWTKSNKIIFIGTHEKQDETLAQHVFHNENNKVIKVR